MSKRNYPKNSPNLVTLPERKIAFLTVESFVAGMVAGASIYHLLMLLGVLS
ncbi:MAG: hypothetical protein JG718_17685 [Candidatus Thiothrix moscowensis]|nr:hypothetical protein [Candidatus Thiothrix moscowensis]